MFLSCTFLLFTMSLSILRGCDADQRFEMFRKMALIGETDGKRNLDRTQRQSLSCTFLLFTMSLSILRGCDADQRFEMFRKMALIGETDGKRNLDRTQR